MRCGTRCCPQVERRAKKSVVVGPRRGSDVSVLLFPWMHRKREIDIPVHEVTPVCLLSVIGSAPFHEVYQFWTCKRMVGLSGSL